MKPHDNIPAVKVQSSRAMPLSRDVYPSRPEKDRNGFRKCRVCSKTCPKRANTFCGKTCVRIYFEAGNWRSLRRKIIKRDKGICQICRRDVKKLKRNWKACRDAIPRGEDFIQALWDAMTDIGRAISGLRDLSRSWVEVDHIKPIVEGGTHADDNLRTLCVYCHKSETRELAKRRRGNKSPTAPETKQVRGSIRGFQLPPLNVSGKLTGP